MTAVAMAANAPPLAPKTTEGRVLIVDDEEPTRIALGRTLRRLGFETIDAPSAEVGLDAIDKSDPDIVFVDLRMPGTDGAQLLRRLQATTREPSRVPSIIVMSGQGTMDDVIEILRLGAVDFLRKPWNLTELMSCVTRAMEIRRRVEVTNAETRRPADGAAADQREQRFASLHLKLRQGEIVVPSAPAVLTALKQLIADPRSGINEIAATVEMDSRVAADIIRVANSAQYAHLGRASSVKVAVTRLGLRHVHNLVQTIFLQGLCKVREPAYQMLLTTVWRRSVARAVAMRALCDVVEAGNGINGDTAYLTGLMADVGASFLLWVIAERAEGKLTQDDLRDTQAAKQIMQRSHEELGGALLERWGMEKVVTTTVARHHRDTPPGSNAAWWSLFVLGEHLANVVTGEEDPTGASPIKPHVIERCAAEFSIPCIVLERLMEGIRTEFETIQLSVQSAHGIG